MMKKNVWILLFVFVLTLITLGDETLPPQATVGERIKPPAYNDLWVKESLNLDIDSKILGVNIVAYRIQWFNGTWSGWYVPGVNDLYKKPGEPYRRYWACFNDPTHRYIQVKYPIVE